MDDVRGALAANLAELRKEENLTQAEFAAQFNYSDKAVSKWERGDSLPDVVMLKTIADLYGMRVDDLLTAGGVAAAILTAAGNVYTGVCIDTACTLGMCAERSAIANMITNGESRIVRLVCVMGDGRVGMPCGACREFMMQLDKDSPGLEILADAETGKTVRLRELMPHWWGAERFR